MLVVDEKNIKSITYLFSFSPFNCQLNFIIFLTLGFFNQDLGFNPQLMYRITIKDINLLQNELT